MIFYAVKYLQATSPTTPYQHFPKLSSSSGQISSPSWLFSIGIHMGTLPCKAPRAILELFCTSETARIMCTLFECHLFAVNMR